MGCQGSGEARLDLSKSRSRESSCPKSWVVVVRVSKPFTIGFRQATTSLAKKLSVAIHEMQFLRVEECNNSSRSALSFRPVVGPLEEALFQPAQALCYSQKKEVDKELHADDDSACISCSELYLFCLAGFLAHERDVVQLLTQISLIPTMKSDCPTEEEK
jgi:hypothetical protein